MKLERFIKLEVSPEVAGTINRLARIHNLTVDEYVSQVVENKFETPEELVEVGTVQIRKLLKERGILS